MKPNESSASRRNGVVRRAKQNLLGLFACLLLLASVSAAQINQKADQRKVENVAPGVEHIEIRRGDFSANSETDRWTIHALIVDPQRARLRLAQAKDEVVGAETVSSMAARKNAIAAINGGYFRTTGETRGEPIGVLAIKGRLLSESVKARAALAINDGVTDAGAGARADAKANNGKNIHAGIAARIALVETKAQLKLGNLIRQINGIDRPRGANELILFTPEFHSTTLTPAQASVRPVASATPTTIEVVVINNRVAAVRDNLGDTAIPRNGFVISASGVAAKWVRQNLRLPGQRNLSVEVKTEINARPEISFKPDFIIGGGPRLLSGGVFVAQREAASYAAAFYRTRHPRTALGWRSDGKFVLVTVDGRQRDSVGMTIEELAALMRELGCQEAINFDGGGSTTMVIKNRIVNHPSDITGERPVSDALLVLGW